MEPVSGKVDRFSKRNYDARTASLGKGGEMADQEYQVFIQEAEERLLEFLVAFESVQNNMRVERLQEFQEQLRALAPDGYSQTMQSLPQLDPPPSLRPALDAFAAGFRHCVNAREAFLGADERNYSLTAMDMRRSLCRGLHVLYGIRASTPALAQYWLLDDATDQQDALETPSPDNDAPVGVIHRRRAPLADYSLYVPESYTSSRSWPLIICLHGAYGRADHHIWSWLRPAKSRGYMLLAPKSLDVTWSILQPERDIASVTAMVDEVCTEYSVDRSRAFLTGLSDGGTYTYLLGLGRADQFAGIAPVAGDLHGMLDDMLRRKQGIELPIHIVHGALDHIFPVETIRSAHALLTRLGYNATYDELPHWGHSYCSYVNEQLVMPWFEGLGAS